MASQRVVKSSVFQEVGLLGNLEILELKWLVGASGAKPVSHWPPSFHSRPPPPVVAVTGRLILVRMMSNPDLMTIKHGI